MPDHPAADGRIESAVSGTIVGWAWRPESGDQVEVEALVDGESVATTRANRRRTALRRAGIGKGRHGFTIEISEAFAGAEHRLEVLVLPERTPLSADAGYDDAAGDGPWAGTVLTVDGEPPRPPAPAEDDAAEAESEAVAAPEAEADPLLADRRRRRERAKQRDRAKAEARAAAQGGAGMVAFIEAPPVPEGLARLAVESVTPRAITGYVAGETEIAVAVDGQLRATITPSAARGELGDGYLGFSLDPSELGTEGVLTLAADGVAAVVAPTIARRSESGATHRLLAHADLGADALPPVLIGRDGWLFADEIASAPAPADELVATILERHAALAALGILYVPVLHPARASIEAARVPAELAAAPTGSLDAVRRALRGADALDPIDLAPILQDARVDGELTLRTAVGLTDTAAFAIVRALLKEAAKRHEALVVPSPAELTLGDAHGLRGELAGRRKLLATGEARVELPGALAPAWSYGETAAMPLPGSIDSERVPAPAHLVPAENPCLVTEHAGKPGRAMLYDAAPDPALLTWLAESVGRLAWQGSWALGPVAVEQEHPDVVFDLIRES